VSTGGGLEQGYLQLLGSCHWRFRSTQLCTTNIVDFQSWSDQLARGQRQRTEIFVVSSIWVLTEHSQQFPVCLPVRVSRFTKLRSPGLGFPEIEGFAVFGCCYSPKVASSTSLKPLRCQDMSENSFGCSGAGSGHLEVGAERCYSASAESRRRGGLETLGLARSRRGTCGSKRRARPMLIDSVNTDSQPGIVLFGAATCADCGLAEGALFSWR
jgi:hypothetical protein